MGPFWRLGLFHANPTVATDLGTQGPKAWFFHANPKVAEDSGACAVMALELGVGAIKNGDGPGAALKAMMRYGSDDVIPPGVA